jgi:hypothetical protein
MEPGSTAAIYFRTDSGNLYRLAQDTPGQLSLHDARAKVARYLEPAVVSTGVVTLWSQFKYGGDGRTGEVSAVTMVANRSLNSDPLQREFHEMHARSQQARVSVVGRPAATPEMQDQWQRIEGQLDYAANYEKLPAHRILANQIDRAFTHLQINSPHLSLERACAELAQGFLWAGTYQRIAEQRMFGVKAYEAFDAEGEVTRQLLGLQRGLKDGLGTIARERPLLEQAIDNGWQYISTSGTRVTDFRIYLSPRAERVGEVFRDIALAIPPGVQFQMKTFDRPSVAEATRLDKIIVYASAADAPLIFEAVRTVHAAHVEAFYGRPAPGGGAGVALEGVSIARQPKSSGRETTGTMEAAKVIEAKLHPALCEKAKAALIAAGRELDPANSRASVALWNSLQTNKVFGFWVMPGLTDANKEFLNQHLRHGLWQEIVTAAKEVRPISQGKVVAIASALIERDLKAGNISGAVSSEQFTRLKKDYLASVCSLAALTELSTKAFRATGLTLALTEAVARGALPSVGYLDLVGATKTPD